MKREKFVNEGQDWKWVGGGRVWFVFYSYM